MPKLKPHQTTSQTTTPEPLAPPPVRRGERTGGRTLAERYGPEHFRAMGLKGGAAVRRLLDRGLAAERAEREALAAQAAQAAQEGEGHG